jgi:hypothetical protein
MSQFKYIAPVVILSLTAALAGTGCMAQAGDEPATDEPEVATATPDQDPHQGAPVSCPKDEEEKTGDAKQACCGGFGGFGAFGFPFGFGGACFSPWFTGFGGCGGFWGGLGTNGFGGCGGFGGGW